MAKNQGMTNSAMFFDGRTKKFDIEKCFNNRANAIKGALKDMTYILEHSENFTDSDLQFNADLLADEFYTILKVSIEWENKKLKIEKNS